MQKPNNIFITGATGNQGGSTMQNLLNRGFNVKAIARDPTKLAPQQNLQIIKGDLNDADSYKNDLSDVDAVFCNLHFIEGVDKEVKQGLDLINEAKKNGVKFFLYSSVIGCDLDTGIPHWESKFKIENHLKGSGLDYAIIRPPSFYENLLFPQVRSRILKGKLVLATSRDKVQQFMSAKDIGKIAATIFSDPYKYRNTTMNLAADQLDGGQLSALLSNVMKRKIKYQQLPGWIARLAMGRDLAKMFRWVNHHDVLFVKDIDSFNKQFPPLLSFEDWIKIHFA